MSEPTTPTPEGNVAEGPTNGVGGMPENDAKFLLECLKNIKGSVTVDFEAVASALQYNNPRSVSNRLTTLKKKYGLAITTTAASAKAATGTGTEVPGFDSPVTPEKVKKPRTPKKVTEAAGPLVNPDKVRKPRTPKKAGEGTGRKKVGNGRKARQEEYNEEETSFGQLDQLQTVGDAMDRGTFPGFMEEAGEGQA